METIVIDEYDQIDEIERKQKVVNTISTIVDKNYHITIGMLTPLAIRLFSPKLFHYTKRIRGKIIAVLGFVTVEDIHNLPVDKIIYTPDNISVVVFKKPIILDNRVMVQWNCFSCALRKRITTILKDLVTIYNNALKTFKVDQKIQKTIFFESLKIQEMLGNVHRDPKTNFNLNIGDLNDTVDVVYECLLQGYTDDKIIDVLQKLENGNLLIVFINFKKRILKECNKLLNRSML